VSWKLAFNDTSLQRRTPLPVHCVICGEAALCKETHDYVIRLAPPLIISEEDLAWVAGQVRRAFAAQAGG
jgi:ornithine--oxo-acid transaminase